VVQVVQRAVPVKLAVVVRLNVGIVWVAAWHANQHLASPEVVRRLAAGGAVQELPAKEIHLGGKAIAARC